MRDLPLVDYLIDFCRDVSLRDVRLIGVQHILGTTHSMLHALYRLGLQPENISLIGKCYSTNQDVLDEMRREGVDVSDSSLEYSSHMPFDDLFKRNIFDFVSERNGSLSDAERVIVIDDGGEFIKTILGMEFPYEKTVAIEQTSSGGHIIGGLDLPFPVISVASSRVKREHETPMIVRAVQSKILEKLPRLPQRCLIVGGGTIGAGVYKAFRSHFDTVIYDRDAKKSHITMDELQASIQQYDLIIGCTGTGSLDWVHSQPLANDVVLVSASSSDREFNAVHFRRLLPCENDCHLDLSVNGVTLLNSGFPINFDGGRHSVPPSSIQLTRALLVASIIQGSGYSTRPKNGIVPLSSELQEFVLNKFLEMERPLSKKFLDLKTVTLPEAFAQPDSPSRPLTSVHKE